MGHPFISFSQLCSLCLKVAIWEKRLKRASSNQKYLLCFCIITLTNPQGNKKYSKSKECLFLWYTFKSDTIIACRRHVGFSESEVTIFKPEGGAFGSAAWALLEVDASWHPVKPASPSSSSRGSSRVRTHVKVEMLFQEQLQESGVVVFNSLTSFLFPSADTLQLFQVSASSLPVESWPAFWFQLTCLSRALPLGPLPEFQLTIFLQPAKSRRDQGGREHCVTDRRSVTAGSEKNSRRAFINKKKCVIDAAGLYFFHLLNT